MTLDNKLQSILEGMSGDDAFAEAKAAIKQAFLQMESLKDEEVDYHSLPDGDEVADEGGVAVNKRVQAIRKEIQDV